MPQTGSTEFCHLTVHAPLACSIVNQLLHQPSEVRSPGAVKYESEVMSPGAAKYKKTLLPSEVRSPGAVNYEFKVRSPGAAKRTRRHSYPAK